MNTYKCFFSIVMLCIVPSRFWAQPRTSNYVKTLTFLSEDAGSALTEVQFYDGLGRPSLHAFNGSGTNGKYVYELKEYDGNGRERLCTRPAVGSTSPSLLGFASVLMKCQTTYSDFRAYSTTFYDALDRPVSIGGTGEAWAGSGKFVRKNYGSNSAGSVIKYSRGNGITKSGFWAAGALEMEETIDEDGHSLQVYRDIEGKTVLERRDGSNDTYFVYNNRNQLIYVLTPMYQEDPDPSAHAYKYVYDSKGRCVEKRLPGCASMQYWYDKYDRLAFFQDGNLRDNNTYRFMLYDDFGRLAVQGICTPGDDLPGMLDAHVTFSPSNPGFEDTGYVWGGSIDLDVMQLEKVCYYDSYAFGRYIQDPVTRARLMENCPVNTAGLLTGSVSFTNNGGCLYTAFYYDEKGRVVKELRNLPDNTFQSTQTDYTFTNKVRDVIMQVTRDGTADSLRYHYTYYPANDQVDEVTLSFNGATPVAIAKYAYNDLGQVSSVVQGGDAASTSYEYNVRGYLSKINGTKYSEELGYADAGCYNGNIGSLTWSLNGGDANISTYTYDGLNRLVGENLEMPHHIPSLSVNTSTTMAYDANGNILSMNSISSSGGIQRPFNMTIYDNQSYTYNGNQLVKFECSNNAPQLVGLTFSSAIDQVHEDVEYTYDGNGNMKQNRNRGIWNIAYNPQNLPVSFSFGQYKYAHYTYTADGEKLEAVYSTPYDPNDNGEPDGLSVGIHDLHDTIPGITNPPFGPLTMQAPTLGTGQRTLDRLSYCGPFIYHDGRLEQVLFDGGYISVDTVGTPRYHYYQRDHLGSVRAVVNEAGTLENTNSYSAFGSVTNANAAYALNRYKYNGKEMERTHGIDCLDYGARWYEPVIGRFTTMDPLSEKYYHFSPYAYCGNNPVNAIDEDGRKIVFVNGYLGFGSPKGGETYWNGRYSSFVRGAQSTLNDYNTPFFTDYDYNYMGSASLLRELQGYQYAKDNYKALIKGMKPIVDKFNFVSHSMGGAFSEGMIRYLAEQGWETNNAVFLNAWEPLLIYNKKERNRIDATCTNDPVQFLSTPIFGEPDIPSSDIKIRIKSNESVLNIHRDLIDGNNGYLWNLINDFLAK